MFYLLLVSFIWAFSFGLIKNQLASLDPTAVAVVRIGLAALVFLPFLRLRAVRPAQALALAATGAVQFGLMYLLYLHAFAHVKAFEIALFTITTPLYLIFMDAALRRKIEPLHWLAAALSVAGTAVIVWRGTASPELLKGFLLIQLSNLCFAAGQIAYRRIRGSMTTAPDHAVFGWLYLGALAVTALTSLARPAWGAFHPTWAQWGVLAYLGVLSSGLCFFWWNRGATRVNAGTLAALNNAKVPLGVACSLLFFHEHADFGRLLLGGGLLVVAVLLAEKAGGAVRG